MQFLTIPHRNLSDHERIAEATLDSMLGIDAGQYADRALNEASRRHRLRPEDRFTSKRWLYRTLRWRARFDAVLQDTRELWTDPVARAAGRLSLAANFEHPEPDLGRALSQVLAERGKKRPASLVAKLPPLALQTPLSAATMSAEALAEAYSHPVWIVERFLADRPDEVLRLLEANNAEPPVTLRTNSLKISRDELQAKLAAEGVATTPGRFSPLALQADPEADIFRTEAFRDGLFELQDEASQLIGWVLDPKPRGLVIDACAGAGGKSLLLACLLRNRARILSVDIY
jgi:16S rRNA (cytosine967-C5)-methyltransferase